ncbi:MAG TPA: hypothetical protein VHT05_05125 [Candidatus Elarobacter sp.]|nr:hypothetical protein [Candidatus Elarobacter sp.]
MMSPRVALVLAGATLALNAQAPAPATSPIPFIGGTHAKGFCTMVRDNVAPSVLGLMKNDDLVGASHRAAMKTASDASTGTADAMQLDELYLRRVALSMAHNLGVIKKLLADQSRFPKHPATDDDRYALLLREQLQAAADRQLVALNHISGIVETTSMGSMRNDIDKQLQSSVGSTTTTDSTSEPGDQFLGIGTLPGMPPTQMFARQGPGVSTVRGQTIWDKLTADIEIQQTHIAAAEQTLTPTVVAAATACKDASTSTPAP